MFRRTDAYDDAQRPAGQGQLAAGRDASILEGAALIVTLGLIMAHAAPAQAAVGDQIIVRDLTASKGWTAVVPLNLDGGTPTDDLLSYNANTGRAVYSVGAQPLGTQLIVRDLIASKGWTAVVPMYLNGDRLTDLLSYNAKTGRTVYSVGAYPLGTQLIVRDRIGPKGWTSIVPMHMNGDFVTDLLWYNKNSGRSVYATGTSQPGSQVIVRDVIAPKGWTTIVPMDLNGHDLTDLLSYNKSTGRAVYSLGASPPGTQVKVRDLIASKGWTSLVPMLLNGDDGYSDLLSYNATTGRAVYSIGTNEPGAQVIVRDLIASTGWTAVVPTNLNADSRTDLLSYNKNTGRAVYSIAAQQ